jgi:hypothetical protein
MNSKQVLDRIVSMLSVTKKEEEVSMTYAKLKDGTIVESPTFDVDEPLEVVSEDGTKSPAPDGEHELALKDSEGNDVLIKVITKDGKIVERENVELEMEPVKPIPSATMEPKANEVKELAEELPTGDGIEGTPEPLPGEEGSPFDMKKMYEEMAYRIEEMEKRIAKMEEVKEEIKEEIEEDMEEDLPKLDGAPIEDVQTKFAAAKPKNKLKESNPQGSFLEKLYK